MARRPSLDEFDKLYPKEQQAKVSRVQELISKIEKKAAPTPRGFSNPVGVGSRVPDRSFEFDNLFPSANLNLAQGVTDFDNLFPDENRNATKSHRSSARTSKQAVPKVLVTKADDLKADETAIDRLKEINRLETRLQLCQGEVQAENKVRKGMDERINQLNQQVLRMNKLVEAKDREIKGFVTSC